MENIPDLNILETVLALLVYLTISFAAYVISIKGIYDVFPNVLKALSAFATELAVHVVLCALLYALSKSGVINIPSITEELNYVIFFIFAFFLVITLIARKVTITHATNVPTSILQSITSLVMHVFYSWIISLLILVIMMRFFPESIDPSIFER